MADEAHYDTHKRKYESEGSPPPPPRRRPTGFSDGPAPPPTLPQSAPYAAVPPMLNDFDVARQKIQELASRALNNAAAAADGNKRSKFDNGGGGGGGFVPPAVQAPSDQKPVGSNIQVGSATSFPVSHGYSGSRKIEVPNGRVGVIIGRAGETIKYLQSQSGARIQVTRDAEHDPNLPTRTVELMGNPDEIAKAEQLINDVLSEADAGGPGAVSRKVTGVAGSEQFKMMVPNNKVGLVIGKGGETIKNIQGRSGARVQVIPLHLPPGDTSAERTVQIDGSNEQIEIAKQMVYEAMESRHRNPAMAGAYPHQGYQAQPPTSWTPQPPQAQQPGGYGYTQQPGSYPGAQYNMTQPAYSGYPPQPAPAAYAQNWDQSNAPQSQQAAQGTQGTGYDYYGQYAPPQQQQQQQQQQPASGPPTDNAGYNYSQQPPTSGGYGQQGYSQDGYGGGYQVPSSQPQSGYYPQQGYGSTPGYGNVTHPPQGGQPPSYNAQGEANQVPPQQGYMGQPGAVQAGFGMPPSSQASGYATPSPAQGGYGSGYSQPQDQRAQPNPAVAPQGQPQPQQSPSKGSAYAQTAPTQPGYPASLPPAAAATYGGPTAQSGAYPPPYGAAPVTPPSYGQQPPAYYGGAYSQPPAYPADGGAPPSVPAAAAGSLPASQPSAGCQTSPP